MFYSLKLSGIIDSSMVGMSLSSLHGLSLTRSISGCFVLLLFAIFVHLLKIWKTQLKDGYLEVSSFLESSREATPKRGYNRITPQIVTIVVTYIYSCYLQLFLYLFIFIDKINLFDCCYTSKLHIYYIYSVFILIYFKSYLFLCIVNQYMYSKFK